MTTNDEEFAFASPELTVELTGHLLTGFPLPMAVTLGNGTVGTTYYDNATPRYLGGPSALGLTLIRHGQRIWTRQTPTKLSSEMGSGYTLRPGEARRMLVDLAEFAPPLAAGRYLLEAELQGRVWAAHSAPVEFELEEPSPRDREIAAELRAIGGGSWRALLGANRLRPDPALVAELSPAALQRVGLHLFLHFAIQRAGSVAELEPGGVFEPTDSVLGAEAAVLRHEILAARGAPAASEAKHAIQKRYRGLEWRTQANEQRRGVMALERTWVGAERPGAVPGDSPYEERS